MRRALGVGSVIILLIFAIALVVLLIPQPCAPSAPGGHFYLCIPPNLVEGVFLALVAAALSGLIGLAAVLHSLLARRRGYALLLGVGLLAVAPGGVLAVVGILTSAMRTINLNEITTLQVSLALLAIIAAPLLASATLLYSGAALGEQRNDSRVGVTHVDQPE
jgi:hypothetical protein